MKTYEIGFGNSYPHYYKLNAKDTAVENGIASGIAQIEGAYLDDTPLEVGDIIVIAKVEHRIDGFVQQRPAKGAHVKPATWFRVNTSYKRTVN